MKKIYMGLCLLAVLLTVSNSNLIAQSDLANCFGVPSAAPNAKMFHLKGFNSPGPLTNSVFFTDIPVGTIIRIYRNPIASGESPLNGADGYTITAADNGKYSWLYPNSSATPPVFICIPNPTNGDCCLKNVPQLLSCTQGAPINFAPFAGSTGFTRVLVKVRAGDRVQLLNTAGQPITNLEEVFRLDLTGTGEEIVCVSYPNSAIIGSVTACGAANCCTTPFNSGGPLPIFLTDFKVSLNQQGKAVLNWASALEIDSKSYTIEKSTNGVNFNEAGQVAASGTTRSTSNYSFTDKNAIAGRTYYRLKMLDIDGKFEYSKVVSVNGKVGNVVTVGPNPFITSIQLYGIASTELSAKNVQVLNAVGQQVAYKVTGANTITLDAAAPAGVYIIKLKTQQFKMLKQ